MRQKKLLFLGAFCMLLINGCGTYRLMYFINRYPGAYRSHLTPNIQEITFQTRSGRQVAFYVTPRLEPRRPPERLWMVFGGNGALALGWLPLLRDAPDPRDGFLLLDYPGFGACQGVPNRTTIRESSERGLEALAAHLGVAPASFEGRLSLLGHSLGCATALQFAPAHRIERIVLLAPFTTVVAVAERMVGWPLCYFVPDNYDNEARLAEVAKLTPRPTVAIVHGARDSVVPVEMGRRLAGRYPDWITYQEVSLADHNSLLGRDRAAVLGLLDGNGQEPPATPPRDGHFAKK